VEAESRGTVRSISAHGDYEDLCQFLACQEFQTGGDTIFSCMATIDVQQVFQEQIIKKGF
jgi:metallo-beta-lactamase family protein